MKFSIEMCERRKACKWVQYQNYNQLKVENNELMHDISIGVCKVCEKQSSFW